MAQVEETQFTSLSARIAALNQQKAGHTSNGATFGKRAPPPLPTQTQRPNLQSRQTINNPPVSTYGSSVTKQSNNQPDGAKANLLPPPPIDRDLPGYTPPSRSPALPARSVPPPLPSRKASAPSPALPPRRSSTQLAPSTQMVRRGSNASTVSNLSTISGMSLSQSKTGSSVTSVGSTDTQRKLPPALGEAKLPPLPPSRRELEEKTRNSKTPLVSIDSAPTLPLRASPVVDRNVPKMPPRRSETPKLPARPELPSRPASRDNVQAEAAPAQTATRLPPVSAGRSALNLGFGNKEMPNVAPSLAPIETRPALPGAPRPSLSAPIARELKLDERTFDSTVAGKFALVDFFAPYCKWCVAMEPAWKKLAETFAGSNRIVIAKVDVDAHKSFKGRYGIEGYPTILFFNERGEPEKYQYSRDCDQMVEWLEGKTGIAPSDDPPAPEEPPRLNLASKPTMTQIKAAVSRPTPAAPASSGCLICRDFSGPDQVASQYPRVSLPQSHDLTGYLADVLCAPFPSITDKARAIFTWLHHNIAYDVGAFFGNRVRHVDPADTITSGLAVCGGYAGLFTAIALKAGMEAIMVTGHGKGYGYSALKQGEPLPPCNPAGHAWNAVRIDGGVWKLIDACWGAGNVGNQQYHKKFTPSYFTMSNEDFGIKHFPSNKGQFFRADGSIPSWEQYYIGPVGAESLQLFGSVEDHGLSSTSFTPAAKHIQANPDEVVRFQFSKVCEHWDHVKNGQGKPYCMILKIWGGDGRKEDFVAFESNEFWWWADVPARDLGCPGKTVSCYAVTTVNGKDARGMTRREYLSKRGNVGMGFGGIAAWELI